MARFETLYFEDGTEKPVPMKWCICGQCEGHGKSSAYLGAYTADEMDEAGQDFLDDYIAGNYDRPCDECGGTGKVQEPDESRMTLEDQKVYWAQVREIARDDAESRMERMMGA